jgi:hypothetical protein
MRSSGHALLILSALLGASCGSASAQPVTAEKLKEVYRDQRAKVRQYYAEYTIRQVIVVTDLRVWKDSPTADPLAEDHTLAMRGQSFYVRVVKRSRPQSDKAHVYDGTMFLQLPPGEYQPGKKGEYWKRVPTKAGLHLPTWYQSWVAFDMPKITSHPRTAAELLDAGKARLASRTEPIDGTPCVVLETDAGEKYYLDPKLGYAIRKMVKEKDGKLTTTVSCGDFSQVAPGVWMPRRVGASPISYSPDLPAEFRGVPLYRYDVVVTKLEANKAEHDKLFSTRIPAGSKVLDTTVPPLQADGTPLPQEQPNVVPYVHYVQPANTAELDAVVSAGQYETGAWFERKRNEQIRRRLWYWGAAAVAGFAVALLVLRYRQRRRDAASGQPA